MPLKVPSLATEAQHHSSPEPDAPSPGLSTFLPLRRDVPAPSWTPASSEAPNWRFEVGMSPPRASPPVPCKPPPPPCGDPATIPLHNAPTTRSITTLDLGHAIRIVLTCIDMCVAMVTMHIASTEATTSYLKTRKKLRGGECLGVSDPPHITCARHDPDADELEHPHAKQVFDLLAWHIDLQNARWYVKPRSTCWFEEYLFNIYTPDMFYDILRMRRRTFDRLVNDLRPFLQGQHTHWRAPIGVEKKVVVTLFKLMHGVSIPLVADKAALGKSTVGQILRQVCSAISINLGHLIAWPVGRRLSRVAAGFQSKQRFPNCIGAIDGSHIYIASPSNTIVAADHRNRNKSFSILLQGVVDSKCYFTSINTQNPRVLTRQCAFQEHGAVPEDGGGDHGRIPR